MFTLIRLFDRLNLLLGRVLGGVTVFLILVQFVLVIANAAFAIGSIWLQELRLYLNALIFLGGVGYTFLYDEHVRVDLLYRDADKQTRNWVDLIGTTVFLVPFVFLIWWAGIPYVLESISVGEASIETGGIPFVYGLKATILLFAASLSLAAISRLFRCYDAIFNDAEQGPPVLPQSGDRL